MFFHLSKTFWMLLGVLLALLTSLVILNLTPPIARDALTHHLAIPKLYLAAGSIYEIPELVFSYYPMNLDILYVVVLGLANDILPKFVHLVFGVASAWLVFQYLHERLTNSWAVFGSLFFLSTPIIVHLSTTAYVDLGVTFFTTATVLLLIRWRDRQEVEVLMLAGLCCGLAAGTKYNGLICIFLLTCFTPFLTKKETGNGEAISPSLAGIIFLSSCLLVLSPWLIRNYLWTANPIYPLFDSVFNNQQSFLSSGMNPLLIRKLIYNEPWWETLLIPVRIFFQGQDNNPQYFDGVLNPCILFFTLFSFIPNSTNAKYNPDKKIFLWFVLLFFLLAFLQRVVRIRYIVPVLPCLIILSVFGINNLYVFFKVRFPRSFLLATVGLLIVFSLGVNMRYLVGYWQNLRPLGYLSGNESRTQFITRFWPEYPLIEFANQKLPESAQILAVFMGNRGYYFDHKVKFDFRGGQSLLCNLVEQNESARDIFILLKSMGFSYLFIRLDLFTNYAGKELSDSEKTRLNSFFKDHTVEIAHSNGFSLLSIVD